MKKTIGNIAIALLAGMGGSFLYNHYFFSPVQDLPAGATTDTSPQAVVYQARYDSNAQSKLPLKDDAFVQASALATPSVVYIKTYYEGRQAVDYWDWFFGYGGQTNIELSSGSGIIVSPDGYILTNNHVIDDAQRIEVIHGKNSYTARLVGTDVSTDLAVLKIEAQNLPAIRWGRSSEVQIGEWVLAVGNPFNLTSTVTAGIVSAKGRRLHLNKGQFPIESFIQTDAPINPGNSGGALVNLRGELIGVNTAILSKHGSYVGYGFAVPADIAKRVYEDLRRYGIVQKAVLGVETEEITPDIVKKLSLKHTEGVVVVDVWKDTPAEKMGLEVGDIITQINNTPVRSLADYEEIIGLLSPGDQVTVHFRRGNQTYKKSGQVVNIDGKPAVYKPHTYQSKVLHAVFEAIPALERKRYGIPNGVKIKELHGGLFYRLGIKEGTIIVRINNIEIEQPEEVEKVIERIAGGIVMDIITPEGVPYRVQFRY
ncbi:trypsin-like peptidase domain-containing protein [Thermonema rossianum]|uniref:trypsin-like peptidase domain-containing protein n=1 Tax=Thermonema rossianum TaxID=55505 RepID=UPI00057158FF|nr:trypsin-like peptidase domain-containing protein [Thermonema rossianum]